MTKVKIIGSLLSLFIGISIFSLSQNPMQFSTFIIGWFWMFTSLLIGLTIWIVRVDELTYAIVKNIRKGEFSRYLEHGYHLLTPFETIEYIFEAVPYHIKGHANQVRSKDGIAYEISYDILLQPNLSKISGTNLSSTIRYLGKSHARVTHAHTRDAIHELFGQLTAEQICQGLNIAKLKRLLRDDLQPQLNKYGFDVLKCFFEAVEPPTDFRQTILDAQSREIETRTITNVYKAFRDVMSTIPAADKAMLTDMETMRILQNGSNSIWYSANRSPQNQPNYKGGDSTHENPVPIIPFYSTQGTQINRGLST